MCCIHFPHSAELCTKAVESISASRRVRGEIKSLIVSVQTKKMEAHGKITSAISRKVEQAKTQQVSVHVCTVAFCVHTCMCVHTIASMSKLQVQCAYVCVYLYTFTRMSDLAIIITLPPIQREIVLERGQVRIAQNVANHQKHSEEIALGIVLGPVSEKHR